MENRGLRVLRFLSLSSTLFVKKTGLKVVLNAQMVDGFLKKRMENRGLRVLRFLSLSSTLFVKDIGLKSCFEYSNG
jgi:hypothetical protein